MLLLSLKWFTNEQNNITRKSGGDVSGYFHAKGGWTQELVGKELMESLSLEMLKA